MSIATTDYEASRAEALLDELQRDGRIDDPGGYAPVTFPPRARPAAVAEPAHEAPPPPRSRVLPRLLAMADSYLGAGSLRQALEMYFDLIRSHPDAPEALLAEDRVLEVARLHEMAGELHSARAIYEQLA